jgi:hypothetical protein
VVAGVGVGREPAWRVRLAVEAALKPWILSGRLRRGRPLAARVEAHPSLFTGLVGLAFSLAERGNLARVTVVKVGDLAPAKLLPPILLRPILFKPVKAILEVEPTQGKKLEAGR